MRLRGILFLMLLALSGAAHADQWALVVGISDYEDAKHIRPLPAADTDAKLIAQTLREVWQVPESNVSLLTSASSLKPTRNQLLTSLAALKRKVKPGDTVFFYLSGHAFMLENRAYLLPQDSNPRSKISALETSLDIKMLTQTLQQLRGATVFLAWDIWQGSLFQQIPKLEPQTLTQESWFKCTWGQPASPPTVSQVTEFYACTPAQQSVSQVPGQPGYFAYYLTQGLRGKAEVNGSITSRSLTDFVVREVSSTVRQKEGVQQTPYARVTGSQPDSVLVGKS